jgi:vacuolar-type H+-ATPase subunit C/Vma6
VIGFEYGNTRIRARRTLLYDRSAYAELLTATDVDQLTSMLTAGPYRTDLEAAAVRMSGPARIDAALSARLAREIREILGFYVGSPAIRLSVLARRWDVRNIVTLVRALARRSGGTTPVLELPAAGTMSGAVLDELASQGALRPMLDLLVTWRLPSTQVVRSFRRVLPDLERSGDPLLVEAAIQRGFALDIADVVAERPDDALSRQLRAEADKVDLSTVARLRRARIGGEPLPALKEMWLGTGSAHLPALESLVVDDEPGRVMADLGPVPAGMVAAVRSWLVHGEAPRLVDDLDLALLGLARRAVVDDPLGIGVPVGSVWELESEVRNLRLVARAVANRLEDVEDRMLMT